MKRIPSLNWLRVFEAAARTGSFARAAAVLNMSPAAVSQQIKALEGALGRPLFLRGPASVSLTADGRAYLPVVAQSLHTVEVATGTLFGDRTRPVLHVQCSLMLATGWLAARLPRFQGAYPEVQVSLSTAVYDTDIRPGGADLAITFGVPAAPSEESDALFGERLYPVARPAIARVLSGPADLAEWPLIEVATHRANWFGLLPGDSPAPRFTYTDNTVTAMALAAATGAIALARAPASDGLAECFGLERCLPGLEIAGAQGYQLVYPARTALSKAALAFREWLLAEATGIDR